MELCEPCFNPFSISLHLYMVLETLPCYSLQNDSGSEVRSKTISFFAINLLLHVLHCVTYHIFHYFINSLFHHLPTLATYHPHSNFRSLQPSSTASTPLHSQSPSSTIDKPIYSFISSNIMADASTAQNSANLTPRENEILILACQNTKNGEIQVSLTKVIRIRRRLRFNGNQVDYAALAIAAGLKDAKSAGAVWCVIKKKVFGNKTAPASAAVASPKPKTPRKAATPKTKKAAASEVTKDTDKEAAETETSIPDVDGEASVASVTKATESKPSVLAMGRL